MFNPGNSTPPNAQADELPASQSHNAGNPAIPAMRRVCGSRASCPCLCAPDNTPALIGHACVVRGLKAGHGATNVGNYRTSIVEVASIAQKIMYGAGWALLHTVPAKSVGALVADLRNQNLNRINSLRKVGVMRVANRRQPVLRDKP